MTPGRRSPRRAIPLACDLAAIPAGARARHVARIATLFGGALRERRALTNGYAYRFGAEALESLASWIAMERRCCPFLHFTLDVAGTDGALWLRISGPAGTPAFLEAELPTERASGSANA